MTSWPRIITDDAVQPDEVWFVKAPIRLAFSPTESGFTVTKYYEILARLCGKNATSIEEPILPHNPCAAPTALGAQQKR